MAIIIILLTLLTIFFFFLHKRKAVAATKLPPSPPGLPLLGNLHQLGSLPHRSLNSLSKRYGPLMLLQLGLVAPTVVVSSAEIAEQVMKTHDLIFVSRPPSAMANHLLYNSTDIAFSPYNDYWRTMKKICIVHLLSSKRVQSYKRVRQEEVALLIADIRAASVTAEAVNLSKRLSTLTNDIISRVALGRKYSGETSFREMLGEFQKLLGCFPMADFAPWLGWIDKLIGLDARAKRTSKKLDEFIERVLEEHLSRRSSNAAGAEECIDFVDVLLSIKDEHDTDDAAISLNKENIKALILDMFAAGTDTTVTTLEWAMAELIKHPALKATIKETLRLHVPVALLVPRVATEDTQLQGYDIPELTPFGAGRRACPGIGFAVAVIEYALANLLHHFDRFQLIVSTASSRCSENS